MGAFIALLIGGLSFILQATAYFMKAARTHDWLLNLVAGAGYLLLAACNLFLGVSCIISFQSPTLIKPDIQISIAMLIVMGFLLLLAIDQLRIEWRTHKQTHPDVPVNHAAQHHQ